MPLLYQCIVWHTQQCCYMHQLMLGMAIYEIPFQHYTSRLDIYNIANQPVEHFSYHHSTRQFCHDCFGNKLIIAEGVLKSNQIVGLVFYLYSGQWKHYSVIPTARYMLDISWGWVEERRWMVNGLDWALLSFWIVSLTIFHHHKLTLEVLWLYQLISCSGNLSQILHGVHLLLLCCTTSTYNCCNWGKKSIW